VITRVYRDGWKQKYRCVNGEWHLAKLETSEEPIQPTVGGIAPQTTLPSITTTSTPFAAL
jgi:hypothetical protein